MPFGYDARRADADRDYQDLYARSTREIHCCFAFKSVLAVRLFRCPSIVFSASVATIGREPRL